MDQDRTNQAQTPHADVARPTAGADRTRTSPAVFRTELARYLQSVRSEYGDRGAR